MRHFSDGEGGRYEVIGPFVDGLAPAMHVSGAALAFEGFTGSSSLELIPNCYGFIDSYGNDIIHCSYEDVKGFRDGFGQVMFRGKWGLFDKEGTRLTECIYDEIFSFEGDKAKVIRNGRIGYIDKKGKEIVPCKYTDYNPHYCDGLAKVGDNGKWGYIDEKGKEVIPCIYKYASDFNKGLAYVKTKDSSFYIDKNGRKISVSSNVVNNSEIVLVSIIPGYSVAMRNGKWGLFDEDGNAIINYKYPERPDQYQSLDDADSFILNSIKTKELNTDVPSEADSVLFSFCQKDIENIGIFYRDGEKTLGRFWHPIMVGNICSAVLELSAIGRSIKYIFIFKVYTRNLQDAPIKASISFSNSNNNLNYSLDVDNFTYSSIRREYVSSTFIDVSDEELKTILYSDTIGNLVVDDSKDYLINKNLLYEQFIKLKYCVSPGACKDDQIDLIKKAIAKIEQEKREKAEQEKREQEERKRKADEEAARKAAEKEAERKKTEEERKIKEAKKKEEAERHKAIANLDGLIKQKTDDKGAQIEKKKDEDITKSKWWVPYLIFVLLLSLYGLTVYESGSFWFIVATLAAIGSAFELISYYLKKQ